MKELRYQLSKEDYMDWIHWNVAKQDMRKSRRLSIILYAAFFVFYMYTGISSGKGITAVLSSLVTVILLGFVMFYMISAKNRERMIWKRSGLKKLEKTNSFPKIILTPDETGFTMEVPGQVKNEFSYADITQIEETPRLYLLGTTDNKWQFLAKSAFEGQEDMEQFKAFLDEKMADAKENPGKYRKEAESADTEETLSYTAGPAGAECDEDADEVEITPVDTSNMGKIGKIAHMMAALDQAELSETEEPAGAEAAAESEETDPVEEPALAEAPVKEEAAEEVQDGDSISKEE